MDTFEFKKEIDEMSEGQLRATAREFRAKHNDQVEEANKMEDDISEYQERAEQAEDQLGEAESYFAEKAAEVKDMDADILADRFDLGELRDMVEDAEEAGEFDADEPEGSDEGQETQFNEKPPKAPVSEDTQTFNDKRAERMLERAALIPEDN